MQNTLLSDILLVLCSSIVAFVLAKAARPAETRLGAVLAILFPILILLCSQYLWASTGKGLLEHITCAALPSSPSCILSEKTPSEDIIDWSKKDYAELVKRHPTDICKRIIFNVQDGTVNGLQIDAKISDIRRKFPCNGIYTGSEKFNNGGGIFYNEQSMYWYTFAHPRIFEIGRQGNTEVIQSTRIVGLTELEIRRKLSGRWISKNGSLMLYKPWGCLTFTIQRDIITSLSAYNSNCDLVKIESSASTEHLTQIIKEMREIIIP